MSFLTTPKKIIEINLLKAKPSYVTDLLHQNTNKELHMDIRELQVNIMQVNTCSQSPKGTFRHIMPVIFKPVLCSHHSPSCMSPLFNKPDSHAHQVKSATKQTKGLVHPKINLYFREKVVTHSLFQTCIYFFALLTQDILKKVCKRVVLGSH